GASRQRHPRPASGTNHLRGGKRRSKEGRGDDPRGGDCPSASGGREVNRPLGMFQVMTPDGLEKVTAFRGVWLEARGDGEGRMVFLMPQGIACIEPYEAVAERMELARQEIGTGGYVLD